MTVFLETLWSAIKEVKAPFMFDVEYRIALDAMQGNRASSRGKGQVSGLFSFAAGTWGIFSSEDGDGPSKLVFVQRRQDSCLVARDTSRLSQSLGSTIGTPLKVRWETQCPFPVPTGIL